MLIGCCIGGRFFVLKHVVVPRYYVLEVFLRTAAGVGGVWTFTLLYHRLWLSYISG